MLAVAVDRRTAVVGPLTVPGRVGCGHCASQRMLAAAAGSHDSVEPDPDGAGRSSTELVREVVTRELAAVDDAGLESTHVLNRVLLVDGRDGEVTSHEFVPLSRCSVCGGAGAFLEG